MLINRRNAMMAGGLSAKSYVQDGLVWQIDGVENVGYGQSSLYAIDKARFNLPDAT